MTPTTEHPAAEAEPLDPAACGLVIDVLTAQLGETARLIERSVAEVCQSFASIARRTKQSAAHAEQALHPGGDDPTAGARDTIAALLARMDQVAAVSERVAGYVARIETIAGQVARIAKALDGVDAVANSLRILALNARIEATRAGEQGKAFGVVAAESGEVARSIGATARAVRGMVVALEREVTENTRAVRDCFRDDRAASDLDRDAGAKALGDLRRSDDDLKGQVAAAAANSARLAEDIGAAVTALQFQDAVSQQLEHVAAALADVREALRTPPGEEEKHAAGWAERLRARYTMHSERAVLDRLAGGPGGTDPDPGSAPGSVELF